MAAIYKMLINSRNDMPADALLHVKSHLQTSLQYAVGF